MIDGSEPGGRLLIGDPFYQLSAEQIQKLRDQIAVRLLDASGSMRELLLLRLRELAERERQLERFSVQRFVARVNPRV